MRSHYHIDREHHRDTNLRAWLYLTDDIHFQVELSPNRHYRHFGISIGRGGRSLKFSVSIPYLFAFYFKLACVLPHGSSREIELRLHDRAIWWKLWVDGWGDERRWPKWRYGSFHYLDFLLGRAVYSETTLEERDVLVPMPEKAYAGRAILFRSMWKRPRWPWSQEMTRCKVDVPEGIPHEGKGENSWDCGIDATFGMTGGECNSIAKGVGDMVGSVLHDRVRYGGYGDWDFKKPWPVVSQEPDTRTNMAGKVACAI